MNSFVKTCGSMFRKPISEAVPYAYELYWLVYHSQQKESLAVQQQKYGRSPLHRHGYSKYNIVWTPRDPDFQSTTDNVDSFLPSRLHGLYRSILGGISYLTVATLHDLTNLVSILSRDLTTFHTIIFKL